MKLKLNLRNKIQLFVSGTVAIIFIVAFGYITFNARKLVKKEAIKNVDSNTKYYAKELERRLNEDMIIVRTLSKAFLEYKNFRNEEWKEMFAEMYKNIIQDNKHILAFWNSWELYAIDSTWNKTYGRFAITVKHQGEEAIHQFALRSMDGDSWRYKLYKDAVRERINDPYIETVGFMEKDLMTTLSAPLVKMEDI